MPVNNFEALQPATLESTDLFVVQKTTNVGSKQKATLPEVAAAVATAVLATKELSVVTEWTDGANGTGVALLTFSIGGVALAEPISGMLYFTEADTGLAAAALDTGATASKGQITPVVAAGTSFYHFITNATGELDLTLTSLADSYWIVFQQQDGTLLISGELAITGP